MSVYSEKFIKKSQKNRRCPGCDNFVTILVGDPYWNCFSAGGGFDAGGFSICVPCHDHLQVCDECQYIATTDGIQGVRECINEGQEVTK